MEAMKFVPDASAALPQESRHFSFPMYTKQQCINSDSEVGKTRYPWEIGESYLKSTIKKQCYRGIVQNVPCTATIF
jgi:hypothetical protein